MYISFLGIKIVSALNVLSFLWEKINISENPDVKNLSIKTLSLIGILRSCFATLIILQTTKLIF